MQRHITWLLLILILLPGCYTLKHQIYSVKVDYSKTLPEIIAESHFVYVDTAFTADRFPIMQGGTFDLEMEIYDFEGEGKVASEMLFSGLRAANLSELLAFVEQYPEKPILPNSHRKIDRLIALNSPWKNQSLKEFYPGVSWRNDSLVLKLYRDEFHGWLNHYYFLGVRK